MGDTNIEALVGALVDDIVNDVHLMKKLIAIDDPESIYLSDHSPLGCIKSTALFLNKCVKEERETNT